MPIQTKIIGRVPLWFEADPNYNPEVGGDFKRADGGLFKAMNRTTYMGSEFQVKVNPDETDPLNRTTVQPPGIYNRETKKMIPNSDWIIISDLTAAWEASELISRYLGEAENPEFLEVHTDDENKVLYGVQSDGNFYFGAGVPRQILKSIPGINPNINGYIYYGTNPEATSNASRLVNNSISGVYQISTQNGSHIYFFVPSSVINFYASINGMEIPFRSSSVIIGGKSYKKYESTNTYDNVIFNIVLA